MTGNFISDTSLRGELLGRVKDLKGFKEFHNEPDDHSPYSKRFVRSAGSDDVAARAESLFAEIRKQFRYKRKEIALSCDQGGASIRTPDFDVALNLEQDDKDAAGFTLVTEVGGFRRPDMVMNEHFISLFSSCCDSVTLTFSQRMDLEAKIDQLEENADLASFIEYDSTAAWFTLRLPQLIVEVTSQRLICRLPPGQGDLRRLVEETGNALTRLAGSVVA